MTGDQLTWIKSSRSMATGACVELASDEGLIALRNSRYSEVVLHFTREEIKAFVEGAARGEFDRLFD